MIWYVALVAILNLGLGYALAVCAGAGRSGNQPVISVADSTADEEQDFNDGDEYYSDDHYDSAMEGTEYESAVSS
jgi:hypothetical protein